MTFNFLGPGSTVNIEARVQEQIILDSSGEKSSWQNFKRFNHKVFRKDLSCLQR